MNAAIETDPAPLLADPCGRGWIACISPTRCDEEAENCLQRRVILLSQNHDSAQEQAKKLRGLGCDVRTVADPRELETAQKDFDSHVLLFDGTTFGTEGPGIVGADQRHGPGA